MIRYFARGRIAFLLVVVLLGLAGVGYCYHSSTSSKLACRLVASHPNLNPRIELVRTFPESINCLIDDSESESVYVGTHGEAHIYRFPKNMKGALTPIGKCLGGMNEYGIAEVNSMCLFRDQSTGSPKLLAGVSQILPMSYPHFYVWDLDIKIGMEAFCRPQIKSSWIHGLVPIDTDDRFPKFLTTCCGHGEVLELNLAREQRFNDCESMQLDWNVVGQMSSSGEQIISARLDSHQPDKRQVCLVQGFASNKANIKIFEPDFESFDGYHRDELQLPNFSEMLTIHEQYQFGNVRIKADDLDGDGADELIAFWVDGLSDGKSKIVIYDDVLDELNATVIFEGKDVFALENQIGFFDVNQDGKKEIVYSTRHGVDYLECRANSTPRPLVATDQGANAVLATQDRIYFSVKEKLYSVTIVTK